MLDRELKEKIDEVSSLINDSEIYDYSNPEIVWDDEAGYSIEEEESVLEDLVWGGMTESEAKTILKEYKERLQRASKIVKQMIDEGTIASEDEIWDYIDEDEDEDFYSDEEEEEEDNEEYDEGEDEEDR
ncbi:hypothetical protein [Athalassotoga saccharophila]|uniref:hypothetical protein n=1 Tax=Athalassotoga saccharophila TaxID=1441386 RepID=UPI00137AF4CF|nr:hypothetical protein [Athalassotoga saccharophila]BBJ28952.1 hypothetical protein ATHSA_1877 [Athalassotoga saccharophila]